MTHDPVCYAEVDPIRAGEEGLSTEEAGRTYYFCSRECKQRFDRDTGAFMELYPEFQHPDQEAKRGDNYSV